MLHGRFGQILGNTPDLLKLFIKHLIYGDLKILTNWMKIEFVEAKNDF